MDKKTKLQNLIKEISSESTIGKSILSYLDTLSDKQINKELEKLILEILAMQVSAKMNASKATSYDELVKILEEHKQEMNAIDNQIAEIEEELNPPLIS